MQEIGVTATGGLHDCGEDGKQVCTPLTVTEARTHFAAWAIVSSPLVLGFDLRDPVQLDNHCTTITVSVHKVLLLVTKFSSSCSIWMTFNAAWSAALCCASAKSVWMTALAVL